jgi:hypothetical protein
MKKTVLKEIKEMNKIAGTQMTKEQEISFIKNRLNELEFNSQKELDDYKKNHKVRPGTKLTVAPLTKRIGNAVSKGTEKAADAIGKAIYTTKLGNSTMKGALRIGNKVANKLGLGGMTDKESDAEVDAWKRIYSKKKK